MAHKRTGNIGCLLNRHRFSITRFIVNSTGIVPVVRCVKCGLEKRGETLSVVENRDNKLLANQTFKIKY